LIDAPASRLIPLMKVFGTPETKEGEL